MALLELDVGEVHFWLCRPNSLQIDNDYIERLKRTLDAVELGRMQRFKFPQHAQQFCISHGMVRYTLSQYADIAPENWTFKNNEYGKPYVSNPVASSLYFSLSHTDGLIAIAVSRGQELGCDVQQRDQAVRGQEIAHRYFSKAEVSELLESDEQNRAERFFDYWSLKESYIKAKGRGLVIGLGNFSFCLNDRPIGFSSSPVLQETDSSWHFKLVDVGPGHSAAIALQQPDFALHSWLVQPGIDYQSLALQIR